MKTKANLKTETARCNRTNEELLETKANLKTETARCNRTNEELLETKANLRAETAKYNRNEEELERTKSDLNSETARYNRTKIRLTECSAALKDLKSKLIGERKSQNVTHWDILYKGPFHNNVLTEELFEQIKSSWDPLSK